VPVAQPGQQRAVPGGAPGQLTPGNLITHLRKLDDAGYVRTSKTGSGVNALTTVALTREGRAALERYTAVLRQLLDAAEPAFPAGDPAVT
jgi:DNA-binding PadR family transcriptional regulator